MFKKKGLSGEILDQVVEKVTADANVWVNLMLTEEHGIVPVTRKEAFVSALYVLAATLVGSMIPLIPFFFAASQIAIWVSFGISCLTLFAVGAYQSLVMKIGNFFFKGMEMLLIGAASALVGWGIGVAFDRLWK